ncbi:hypothetical protein EV702DRAFT_1207509 [Suillus placidus]|uniref:Uncharacterized protein n=1 Tax=Suillus placidus TaxID=48579 RepID=A0A9P7CW34_9AGAM|nr:hypothetical protein EV702DRAFT_1207509 [Suillus placidus]
MARVSDVQHHVGVRGVANLTTLGFFPHLWGKLLDYAKANFRLYLTISDPFPAKEDALSGVCGEAIMKAIVHWQDQKCQVEKVNTCRVKWTTKVEILPSEMGPAAVVAQ